MSRSKRPPKYGKCCCGLCLVPFLENVGRKPWNPGCPHPVMHNVMGENRRFLRYRSDRSAPIGQETP